MKRSALVAALVLAIGGSAVAIAQPGGGPPEDPGAIADEASAFGECVSEAAREGVADPEAACEELRPGAGGSAGQNGSANGGPHAAACEEESKQDGSFGRCVSEEASAFGRCVAEQAQTGSGNPTEACTELRPDNGGSAEVTVQGPPEGTPQGPPSGTPQGPPEGTPQGPPSGTPQGPPAGTPRGQPEGTPQGKPEGTPEGQPEGTPEGQPEGTPEGQPEGTPEGQPEGTPQGPPEGAPQGKPEGTPGGPPNGS